MERLHQFLDWFLTDDDVAVVVYGVAVLCSIFVAVELVLALT